MPDFPSELVEAAAKELTQGHPPHVVSPEWAADRARAIVARVEQRAIDRLARESGEGVND